MQKCVCNGPHWWSTASIILLLWRFVTLLHVNSLRFRGVETLKCALSHCLSSRRHHDYTLIVRGEICVSQRCQSDNWANFGGAGDESQLLQLLVYCHRQRPSLLACCTLVELLIACACRPLLCADVVPRCVVVTIASEDEGSVSALIRQSLPKPSTTCLISSEEAAQPLHLLSRCDCEVSFRMACLFLERRTDSPIEIGKRKAGPERIRRSQCCAASPGLSPSERLSKFVQLCTG